VGSDKGVGVHQSYKDEAAKGCDVLFHVSIKGRHTLVDDIPLHMSIKIFKSLDEFDLDELKAYVKEHDISSPDPQCMIFKPIIFKSEYTGLEYYMLKIEGLPPKYKALYDKYDKVGNVYKQFMTHVTIDKEIYDDIKENGITADDIEFSHLVLEKGAGNTYHDFGKSEGFGKSDYGPKHMGLYSHADNAKRKEGRTGEVAHVGPNKAVQHAGPTRNDQAAAAAKDAHQKSRKNPVKVFNRNQIRYLNQKAAKHGSLGVPIRSKLAASEDAQLEKGIKHVAAAVGTAAALMSSPMREAPASAATPPHIAVHQQAPTYNSGKMLRTIASVETNNGQNVKHKPVGGIHGGETAFGKYGLMPNTIRETIGMNRDLKTKHGKATNLKGDDMRRYMEDNPGLEDAVAQRHLARLEHHFGQDPSKIGYSWLEGIRGTYKAMKEKKDIENHWHVTKIRAAYGKEK